MSEISSENNVYRLLRIARDMKVKDLADTLGVSSAYICAIESGKREPSTKMLADYAEALGVDANTLLFFRNSENHPTKFESFLLKLLQRIAELDSSK